MRTASAELIALLNSSQQFIMADLLTIALKDGSFLRYTSADISLSYGGNTFSPFPFKRGTTRLVVGVEVDTLDITLYAGVNDLISGQPMPRFAQNGGFDGATVTLERAFLADWAQQVDGALWLFSGGVSEISPTRTEIRLDIKSDLELLNIQMPRNLYQPMCGFTLFDSGCALSKALYKASSAVAAGSTRTTINCGLAQTSGWFTRGTVSFTSGPNAGITRTIKDHTTGVITLALPLQNDPVIGDGLDAYPGCDKLLSTCETKFNNKAKFRGFPYVPVPETAY